MALLGGGVWNYRQDDVWADIIGGAASPSGGTSIGDGALKVPSGATMPGSLAGLLNPGGGGSGGPSPVHLVALDRRAFTLVQRKHTRKRQQTVVDTAS